MKPFLCLLCILFFGHANAQRAWAVNDSTSYTLGNIHIVAERHHLYVENNGALTLIRDFTQQDQPEYYIRDFDFISAQQWYVLVGSRYIGQPTRLYQTLNAGTDWQLILPESFTVTEFLDGKADSINQIQVLDGRIYLFNGYYISNLLYSDDLGQTWTYWFESLIAHYYQMYRCGDTYYLYGMVGDGFRPYMFEVPASLLTQQNVTNFYSGCHNVSPNCYYPTSIVVPEVVAYFDNVFAGICNLGISEIDKTKTAILPNPVSDIFEIRSDDPVLKVMIYNPAGQLLASYNNVASCDIRNFAAGLYLVAIETEKSLSTIKFFKK